MKKLLYLATLSMAAMLALAPAAWAQDPGAYNCDDFATQAKAQAFFKANNPQQDPYFLDADDDGVVCETLPPGKAKPPPPVEPPPPVSGGKLPAASQQYAAPAQYDQYAAPATIAQYDQYVAPATALPDTGGLALPLVAGALLLGSGVLGLSLLKRAS